MAISYILGADCSERNARFLGGKASHLKRLQKTDLSIPAWICVSSRVYEQALKYIWTDLQTLWQSWLKAEINNMEFAKQLQALTATLHWPAELEIDLTKDLLQAGFSSTTSYAVRSSALGEDAENQSFAGLFQSHLNVQAADISERILAIWRQTLSLPVFEYLKFHQLSLEQLNMAVLIQEMIPAEVSGVYFCASPDGNLNQQIIVASYGLGVGIVDGSIPVDTWIRDRFEDHNRDGKIIWHADIQVKDQAFYQSGNGIEHRAIAESLQHEPSLSQVQLEQILQAGQQISQLMGSFQDIEWSYADNNLWILQSRRISTLPPGPYLMFDNSNIVESYPDIVLPLSASLIQRGYQQNLQETLLQIGINTRELDDYQAVLQNMIASIQGRLYYHMFHWQSILSLVPGIRQLAWKSFAHLIQRSQLLESTELDVTTFKKNRTSKILTIYPRLIWKLVRLPHLLKQHQQRFQTLYQDLLTVSVHNMNIEELILTYDDFCNRFLKLFHSLLLNDLWLGICSQGLKKLLPDSLVEQDPQIYVKLISHIGNLESYQPLRILYDLARELNTLPDLGLAISHNAESAWHSLAASQDSASQNFLVKLQHYLARYGMRGPDELKLETVSMQDQPWQLLSRLYFLSQDLSQQNLAESTLSSQQAMNLLKQNGSIIRFVLCKSLIKQIHRALQRREIGRFNRTRKLAAVRRLFRELAQKLSASGQLTCPEDIYYLDQQELINSLNQSVPLLDIANTRRQQYQIYAQSQPRSRLLLARDPNKQVIAQHQFRKLSSDRLYGTACSSGEVSGPILCVTHPRLDLDVRGKILVCASTDPGWILLMAQALGLIVEQGNLLSHAAIMARELNLPTIVGVQDALMILKDGDRVTLNASQGWIKILDEQT